MLRCAPSRGSNHEAPGIRNIDSSEPETLSRQIRGFYAGKLPDFHP